MSADPSIGECNEMKILFVSEEHPYFGPTGGIGSYLAIIAPALARKGHDVHVMVCRGSSTEDVTDEDVHLHLRPLRPIPIMHRFHRLTLTHKRLSAASSTSRALRGLGSFDVIEAPEWMAQTLFLREKQRARLIVHLHSSIGVIAKHGAYLGRDARLADRLERRTIERARAVTSPSALLLTEIEAEAALRDKVNIIRLPIDLESWQAHDSEPSDGPTVLIVGRLEERKGIDVLVEAMSLLPEPLNQIPIVAIGRSSGKRDGLDYVEWVKRLANDKQVTFEHREPLSRNDLARWYSAARVLAVPSRFESFSMAAVEGMASGTPVVCTNTCGAAELIAASEAGKIVPPDDPVTLKDALLPYLEDEATASRAGEVARAIVMAGCAADIVATQRERLYEECAS
jgi:glycogen synthase